MLSVIAPSLTAITLAYLVLRLLLGGKGRVSLLPEELSCPEERLGMFKLPSLKKRVDKI